jgi:hypothetical protein
MVKKEYCIMEPNPRWKTERFEGSHRHEVFGAYNRQKSIEDGLVIFLRPEDHNMSERGIHANIEFDLYAKRKAQLRWMEYYGKTTEDFIKRYGKNYL